MMKKNILSLLFLALLPFLSSAQKWEVGLFGGISHYNGDLSEGLFMTDAIHPTIGGLIRYNVNYKWSIRASAYYGKISGSDEFATDEVRRQRNLSFYSNLTEISITPEFNFTGYKIRTKRFTFSPFAYAGLAIFKYSPMADMDGSTWNLQQMRTEGQGSIYNQQESQKNADYPQKPYALTQVSIPMGLGIKWAIGKHLNFTFEVSARKTFTDYLDDVSHWYVPANVFYQTSGDDGYKLMDRRAELTGLDVEPQDLIKTRGNSTTNDWYYFHGITLTYTFFPPACFKF